MLLSCLYTCVMHKDHEAEQVPLILCSNILLDRSCTTAKIAVRAAAQHCLQEILSDIRGSGIRALECESC